MVEYDFDVVGGPYDGAPALAWRDDGKHPPPDVIFVGVCERGECGSSKCRGKRKAHVSYWTPDEDTMPRDAVRYRKQNEFVKRDDEGELHGHAVYAIGGLMDPRNFGEMAREPVEFEGRSPVTALAHPGDLLSVFALDRDAALFPHGRHERGWPR